MSEEEQIILPERFKKIDYLISGGGQYIDTKYVPTNKTGYSIIFKTYQTDKKWRPVFGLYEPNITDNRIYFYTNPYPCVGWGTYNQLSSTSPWQNGEITCKFNYLNSSKVDLTCEGNSLSYDLTPLNFTPTVPLYLFSANGAQNIDINSMVGRISSFIITEGDEVVRHFVPCLDGDNVPCMYEIYTGEIHKNLGNGQFYYPNYYPSSNYNLPAGFKKCVYLQSDGTQWIDTGVIPDNETGLYYKALQLSYGNFVMFGVSENDEEIYPPIVFVKDIYYRWGKTRPKMMSWDKAGDLIFHSSLNLYNSKIAHFNSEDTDVERHVTSQTGTYTIPIWLFSYNCNGAYHETYGKWGGRIYRAQITQGVVLIRDFVPCLDANGRPCMYDLIEEEVFYNQSGGAEFTYCVEHELPSDFIKLKYLESETTQFIKTGYVPTNNTGIYIDCYNTFKTTSYTLPISMRETLGDTYITVGRVLKQGNPGFGWGAFTTLSGSGDCRYEATLNWLNDKKSTITAPAFLQRINTLSDLAFTPTKDLCMFGNHDYDGKYYTSSYRIYRAKISEGSEIVRDFVPAYDNRRAKPCMYDLINNVAYYNDGEGEFIYNRDFEGTYRGCTGLGYVGNRMGGDYNPVDEKLPSGYRRVDFLESTQGNGQQGVGQQWINTELYVKDLSFKIEYANLLGKSGNGSMVFGIEPNASGDFFGVVAQSNTYGIGYKTMYFKNDEGTSQYISYSDVPAETRAISEVNLQDLYCYIKVDGKGAEKKSIENMTHKYADYAYPCGLFSREMGGIKAVTRIYSFEANYNGIPAANYIPAIDTAGIPCMYDTVTDKSLYNQGDGQFIVGLKTISHALQLYLPDSGGTISLSLPTNDKTEIYEEKIRANNPNWEITFYYH